MIEAQQSSGALTTGEAATSSATGQSCSDVFAFDLANDRMNQAHTGPGLGANETTNYTYNGDDQLKTEVSSITSKGETDYTYDANGSQTDAWHRVANTHDTYTFDVRDKMVGATVNGVAATYVYDDAGNRVQEATGGTTTFYLTDTQNPTGYAQPIEEWKSTSGTRTSATLGTTYLIGDRIFAQANASGAVSYLLVDGHGSTQQMANSSGVASAAFRYSAFGAAVNFAPSSADTTFLFGSDAIYDRASEMYLNGDGARWRDGSRFIEADLPSAGTNFDPVSLHKYLYAAADPIDYRDPSGHDFSLVDMAVANSIVNLVVGMYGGVFAGAYGAAYAVKTSGDILEAGRQFLLDSFDLGVVNDAIDRFRDGDLGISVYSPDPLLKLVFGDPFTPVIPGTQAGAGEGFFREAGVVVSRLARQIRAEARLIRKVVQLAANAVPGVGAVRGTQLHKYAENIMRLNDIASEVAYLGGIVVNEGTPGCVEVDAVSTVTGDLLKPTIIYDIKSGTSGSVSTP